MDWKNFVLRTTLGLLYVTAATRAAADRAMEWENQIQISAKCSGALVQRRIDQPDVLVIGPEDIRRGYVVRWGAGWFDVPDGYQVRYELIPEATYIAQVTVASFEPDPSDAKGAPQRRHIVFTYRLGLSSSAKPGRYPWPVCVAIDGSATTF